MFQPKQFQILENQSRNLTTLSLIVVDHRKILKLKICEVGNKSMVKFLFQSHLMFFSTVSMDTFDRTQDSFYQNPGEIALVSLEIIFEAEQS